MNLETFHFLRPEWLWSLLLLIPFGWSFLRRARSTGQWERVCDPHLLPHLVARTKRGGAFWSFLFFTLGWSAAALALAGPAWERLPQQTFREPDRNVFVLGLGESMNGRDVRPSRITRARHKLLDAVDRAAGGATALVVYREEAFAVTPLTDDANVLREVIPLLDTRLMPGHAVHPGRGIEEALRLLEPVGARGAQIVLVTDGTDDDPDATSAAVRSAVDAGARVSVLGIAGVSDSLAALAHSGGGAAAALAIDDTDLDRVLAKHGALDPLTGVALSKSDIRADDWKDMGAWLLWIPLALAPFAFRRGWAGAVLALLCLQLAPAPARAAELDLFQRPDQKGARAFAEGRYEESAQHFENPEWLAAARYRAGDYAGAAEALAKHSEPDALYNLGNALAKAGKLEDALASYERALIDTPDDADTRFNRDLVKKLLEEQQQQQKKSKDPASDAKQQDSDSGKGESGESQDPGQQQKSADSQQRSDAKQEAAKDDTGSGQDDGAQKADANDAAQSQSGGEPQPSEAADQQDAGAGDRHDTASDAAKPEPGDGEHQPQEQAAAQEPRKGTGQDGEPTDPDEAAPPGDVRATAPSSAEDQEHAQWMARLPDDPGGLLRERIRRDYQRKRTERRGGGGS